MIEFRDMTTADLTATANDLRLNITRAKKELLQRGLPQRMKAAWARRVIECETEHADIMAILTERNL